MKQIEPQKFCIEKKKIAFYGPKQRSRIIRFEHGRLIKIDLNFRTLYTFSLGSNNFVILDPRVSAEQ